VRIRRPRATDDDVVEKIRAHLASDHPQLLAALQRRELVG
jgi:hypothetical protein